MIRVQLPAHLRTLARVDSNQVELDVPGTVTIASILDALEARFPVLKGTVRETATQRRRPLVRFYACREDWSHEPMDRELPPEIANGTEPFLIVGAMAGG